MIMEEFIADFFFTPVEFVSVENEVRVEERIGSFTARTKIAP